jgi:hypothetical protein
LVNHPFAPAVLEIAVKWGVLWPTLDRAFTLWGDAEVGIPESMNLFVYPSLWRTPSIRHRATLAAERPDLADDLKSLPCVVSVDH